MKKKSITVFAFLLTAAFCGVSLLGSDTFDLLEMSEKLDQADKQDFLMTVDKANICTRQHNFKCTDIQLTKASKLANGSRDQQTLLSVRKNMANEKNMMLKEQQRIMEEDRKAQAAQAERFRRQQAAADKSNDFQWGKAAALLGGSMIGRLDKLSSDVQAKVITGILKDSAGGQEGINNFTEVANSRSNTNKPTSSNEKNLKTPDIDESWKKCGPNKTCRIGDGLVEFCSGPPKGNMCKSECQMDSLVIYHDTRLSNNAAYIPGNYKCPKGTCDVVNSCD